MSGEHFPKKSDDATGITRRRFLQISGSVLAAGGALAVVPSTAAAFGANGVTPVTSTKVVDNFSYKKRDVQVIESGGMTMLHLNGKQMQHHVFAKTSKGYFSHLLPFKDYDKSSDLAKKLIDSDGVLFKL